MNYDIINIIVNIGCTILGTILGWFLNILYESRVKKVKLYFKLQTSGSSEDDLMSEFKTKYSDSGYQIEVYNIGNTPFVLEQVSLQYKKKIITDCFVVEENEALQPYKSYIYQLSFQEYNAIMRYCQRTGLKKCKIFAYDVSGKWYKGTLDLQFPYMQMQSRM